MSQQKFESTTQKFLDIHDIANNLVILKNGTVSFVLGISAMNFGLLAEAEQDAIIYTYAALLNSLNYPIQIIVQSQTKDATKYLKLLKQQEGVASSKDKQDRIARYRDFVSNLIRDRNVLDKKFYVVVPATPIELGLMGADTVVPGRTKFNISKYEKPIILEKAELVLEPKRDHLISQFARIGLYARQLSTQEIIRVFYINYNPEAAEGQEMADSIQYTTPLVRANLIEQAQLLLKQKETGQTMQDLQDGFSAAPTNAVQPADHELASQQYSQNDSQNWGDGGSAQSYEGQQEMDEQRIDWQETAQQDFGQLSSNQRGVDPQGFEQQANSQQEPAQQEVVQAGAEWEAAPQSNQPQQVMPQQNQGQWEPSQRNSSQQEQAPWETVQSEQNWPEATGQVQASSPQPNQAQLGQVADRQTEPQPAQAIPQDSGYERAQPQPAQAVPQNVGHEQAQPQTAQVVPQDTGYEQTPPHSYPEQSTAQAAEPAQTSEPTQIAEPHQTAELAGQTPGQNPDESSLDETIGPQANPAKEPQAPSSIVSNVPEPNPQPQTGDRQAVANQTGPTNQNSSQPAQAAPTAQIKESIDDFSMPDSGGGGGASVDSSTDPSQLRTKPQSAEAKSKERESLNNPQNKINQSLSEVSVKTTKSTQAKTPQASPASESKPNNQTDAGGKNLPPIAEIE